MMRPSMRSFDAMPETRQTAPSRQLPRWLRLLLMALLIVVAGLAFYLNFEDVIERLRD